MIVFIKSTEKKLCEKMLLNNSLNNISNSGEDSRHSNSLSKDLLQPIEKLLLNARGIRFQIPINNVDKIPNGRLAMLKLFLEMHKLDQKKAAEFMDTAKLCDSFDENEREFFFNKNPSILRILLNFYELKKPYEKVHLNFSNLCAMQLDNELKMYWLVKNYQDYIEIGCLLNLEYSLRHIEERLDEKQEILKEHYYREDFGSYCFPEFRRKLWNIVEHPRSSLLAIIYAVVSYLVIILSVFDIVFRTLNDFRPNDDDFITIDAFFYIEILTVAWFSLEFIIKLIICPNKFRFLLSLFTWCQFFSFVPFYFYLAVPSDRIIEFIKDIGRIFRVITLLGIFRFSDSLSTILITVKRSFKEILVFLLYFMTIIVTFSTLIFYFEINYDSKLSTDFYSIPATFWYAVVSKKNFELNA